MSFHYRIHDNSRPYFITITVVNWIDVFMRKIHNVTLIDSLKYCQEKKGLEIFAWCLMPSHLHLIVRAREGFILSDIVRDFKTFTSKKIIKQILDEPERSGC